MKNQETDDNKMNEFFLGDILKRNPFLVPEGYFSALKKETLLKRDIAELGESSFILPENYQESLRQDILSKISEDKLRILVPKHEFSTPSGYFDNLQKKILSKTSGAEDANIVELNTINKPSEYEFIEKVAKKTITKRIGIRRLIPYAAAASITIAIGLFTLLEGVKNQSTNYSAQIHSLPSDEIISYLAFYSEVGDLQHLSEQLSDRTDGLTEGFSSQEIEDYLEYGL